MSLKLITRNVQVTGTSGPEPGDALAPQSTGAPNEQVVDLGSLGPRGGYPIVTVHFTSGTTTGNVDVPIAALPADRRRGWSELPSGADDVLAYHLMEEQGSTVVLLRVPKTENWMQELPDDRRVTEICIPGTHESAALHGCRYGIWMGVDDQTLSPSARRSISRSSCSMVSALWISVSRSMRMICRVSPVLVEMGKWSGKHQERRIGHFESHGYLR